MLTTSRRLASINSRLAVSASRSALVMIADVRRNSAAGGPDPALKRLTGGRSLVHRRHCGAPVTCNGAVLSFFLQLRSNFTGNGARGAPEISCCSSPRLLLYADYKPVTDRSDDGKRTVELNLHLYRYELTRQTSYRQIRLRRAFF